MEYWRDYLPANWIDCSLSCMLQRDSSTRPSTWSRQATATTTSLVVRSWTRGVQTVRLDVSLSPRSWSGLPRVTLWAYLICVQDKNYAQRLLQLWWFQLHDILHLAIGLFLLLLLSCGTHWLPGDITSATSLLTFRHKLKTFLFRRSYGAWLFWTLCFCLSFLFFGFYFLMFLRVFIVL